MNSYSKEQALLAAVACVGDFESVVAYKQGPDIVE